MDLLFIVLFLVSIFSLIWGLSLIIGLGWAILVFDIILHQIPLAEYSRTQKSYPSTKTTKSKILGLVLIIFSLLLFYLLTTYFK